MLTMSRDHKLYYEAYNDYSDLNEDGSLDIGYKPAAIDYYGYFDSYNCYSYSNGEFIPVGVRKSTASRENKKCGRAAGQWSGDFLNYVTTSRMDALRKVLYGGYRYVDTADRTVLERASLGTVTTSGTMPLWIFPKPGSTTCSPTSRSPVSEVRR